MASLEIFCIVISIWTFLDRGVLASEYCYNYQNSRSYYCEYGCCGDHNNIYCCEYNNVGAIAGAIAGGVIAGIVVIAIIVALIFAYMQHRKRAGKVIAPATTNTVTVVRNPGQPMVQTHGQASYPTGAHQPPANGQPFQGNPYPPGSYGQYPTGPAAPPGQGLYGAQPAAGAYSNPVYPPNAAKY